MSLIILKGTPPFMAVEVQAGAYIYKRNFCDVDINVFLKEPRPTEEVDDDETGQLIHNYLHDIESVWWMAIYILMSTVPISNWCKDFNVETQRDELHEHFPQRTGVCPPRKHLLDSWRVFKKHVILAIDPQFEEEAIQLVFIGKELCDSYYDFYADMEKFRCDRGFTKLYQSFHEKYLKGRDVAPGEVKSIHSIPEPKDRPHLEVGADGRSYITTKRPVEDVDGSTASTRPNKRR
jgi:hypothetical protein